MIGLFPEVGQEIAGCALEEERHGAMFQRLFSGRELASGGRVLVAVAPAYPRPIEEVAAAVGRSLDGIVELVRAAAIPGYASRLHAVVEVEPAGQPMTSRGRLPDVVAARIGSEIAGILARAHEQGVALLGLRPEVTYLEGTPDAARLGGVAPRGVRFLFGAPPARGGLCMRDVYLPREAWVAGGGPSAPADVFALCATIWFAATGAPPFPAVPSFERAVERVLAGELPEWPGSTALGDVLIAGLATEAARRPSAAELADQLAAATRTTPWSSH